MDLLSSLPSPLVDALFAAARSVEVGANQVLFLAGDPGDGCYRINRGLLKVTVVSPNGGERILAILGPGAMVGEFSLLDGAPRSASVTAITDMELSLISRRDFEAFAERHPQVYRHLVLLLVRRSRHTNSALAAMSFLSLKGRVAHALLSLAGAFGEKIGPGRLVIRQPISQSDLAAMAGVARENVNRVLRNWRRLAVVSRVGHYYCVENEAELIRDSSF
jgi:CRP-like cAMP-binding protein